MVVHFRLGSRIIDGAVVPLIGSGVVSGRIPINGGRESALLVSTGDGPRVIRADDVVNVEGAS